MPFIPIIVVEIISVFLISSANPHSTFNFKNNLTETFQSVLAQEASNSADTNNQTPSDQTPLPDQNTLDQTPPDQPAATNQNSSPTSTTPSDGALINGTDNQMPTSSENPSPSTSTPSAETNNLSSPESFRVVTEDPSVSRASETVINGSDVVTGPAEDVNQITEQISQKQDQALEQAQTPQEKATLSVSIAKEEVKEAEASIRSEDFSTVSFVTQRLSDHIDTAFEESQKSNNTTTAEQLRTFCRQADLLFKTQELVVPDESEQDYAILRGKCLNVTQ